MAKPGSLKTASRTARESASSRDTSVNRAAAAKDPAPRVTAPRPPVKETAKETPPSPAAVVEDAPPVPVALKEAAEVEQHARFKVCAETHGVRLHRIHVLSATKLGSFQSTLVFDCVCGQRWLLRVMQGDVVSVDTGILEELRRGREGQATAPPGYPGAPASQSPARKG